MSGMFQRLFSKKDNIHFITDQFVKVLGVNVNRQTLEDALEEHPDFPSLLAVKDVLSNFGLDSFAVKLEEHHLPEIQDPFISRTKLDKFGDQYFTVVRSVGGSRFEYLDPKSGKWVVFEASEYNNVLTSVALFAEVGDNPGEQNYTHVREKNKKATFFQWFKVLLLPVCALLLLGWFTIVGSGIGFAVYFFLYLLGTAVGSLLLLAEVDQHNPLIKQVCSGGSMKTNCNAVLQSNGANIWGLSWSLIGFSYFLTGLIVLSFVDAQSTLYLGTLSALSLAALPYIVYSLYYQWRIVKQWCRLCLAVQAILTAQVVVVVYQGWYLQLGQISYFPVREVLSLILLYTMVVILGETLIRLGKKAKEGKNNKQSFIRLKSNPEIFEGLIRNQRQLSEVPNGLGIILGNPEAKHTLIKVCNPYCGPCAKAHPDIDRLLRQNKDLKVQIIFTATNDAADRKAPPVKHLLAIAREGDEAKTRKALDDWYLAPAKDYALFAAKHPLSDSLDMQSEHLEKMDGWCRTIQIKHTPTYFLNGYELPQIYHVGDLDYFLKA